MAALLMLSLAVNAAGTQTLTINGEKVEKVVARITFDGDNVILLFGDETQQSADMSSVTLQFTLDDDTAIEALRQPVGDLLNIKGLEPGTHVSVYNAKGEIVASVKASDAQELLQTGSLKKGVYLIKAGKHVVKFIKK